MSQFYFGIYFFILLDQNINTYLHNTFAVETTNFSNEYLIKYELFETSLQLKKKAKHFFSLKFYLQNFKLSLNYNF